MASFTRILLLSTGGGLLLVVGAILTVLPGSSDASDNPALRPLLHRPLRLARPAVLYTTQPGSYLLCANVLTEDTGRAAKQLAQLPAGKSFTLQQFKYYEERESGAVTLVGLGEMALPSGVTVPFEYAWGRANSALDPAAPLSLPKTLPIWAASAAP